MDPFVVFDSQQVLHDRFALTLAAAMRSRALKAGKEPRIDRRDLPAQDLALHEIAAGAFTDEELAPFRVGQRRPLRIDPGRDRLRIGHSDVPDHAGTIH